MTHLTDSDLLEFHFIPDGEPRTQKHLGSCAECASRMTQLSKRLRDGAETTIDKATEKPESFWVRQRLVISRAVTSDEATPARSTGRPVWRWTAAAALTLFLSAAVVYRTIPAPAPSAPPNRVAAAQQTPGAAPAEDLFRDLREINDPWSSESLKPFQGAVQWESWTSDPDDQGDSTL
ncbi:MAG: hypothetical protein ABI718_08945 [Acidobacteriota bacterium]